MSRYDRKKTVNQNQTGESKFEKTKAMSIMLGVEKIVLGDRSSFIRVKKQLENYLAATYGQQGTFTEDNKYTDVVMAKDAPEAANKPTVSAEAKAARYEKRYEAFQKRADIWRDDKFKIFGEISTILNSDGENVVRSHADYEQSKKDRDPLALWKIIVLTHSMGSNTGSSLQDKQLAKREYNSLSQRDNQSLIDFRDNFQLCLDNLKLASVENAPKDQDQAMDFLDKVNKRLYGELVNTLFNNCGRGHEEYPTTLAKAYNICSNYKTVVEPATYPSKATAFQLVQRKQKAPANKLVQKDNGSKEHIQELKKTRECFKCGKLGHWKNECTAVVQKKSNGHASMVINEADAYDEGTAFNTTLKASVKDRDVFVWDTGATSTIVNNLELLSEVRKLETPLVLAGVNGKVICEYAGKLGEFGDALFNGECPCNLISANVVENLHCVKYFQLNKYEIFLSETNLSIAFNYSENGLYTCDLKSHFLRKKEDTKRKILPAIEEKKREYTSKEVVKAAKVAEMLGKLGHAAPVDLVRLLNNGGLINCPITSQDVANHIDIYGTSPEFSKGRMTVKGPVALAPTEQVVHARTEQTFHTDIMFVDDAGYLLTVMKPTNLVLCSDITTSKNANSVKTAIATQIALVKQKGFVVRKMYCDADASFVALKEKWSEIEILPCGAGSHEPVSERTIRVVKDRIRSIIAGLKFTVPKPLMKWLIFYAVNRINCVVRTGVGKLSAREAFLGIKMDFNIDFNLRFGDYVQVYKSNKRSSSVREGRSVGCIALMPTENGRGTWRFFVLSTGMTITSDNWNEMMMPVEVITHMNALNRNTSSNAFDEEGDETIVSKPESHVLPIGPLGNKSIEKDDQMLPIAEKDAIPSDKAPDLEGENAELEGETLPEVDTNEVVDDGGVNEAVLHISMKKGINMYENLAEDAMKSEIQQMVVKKVFSIPKNVPDEKKNKVIRSSLFFKEKLDSNGNFIKIKARLVAGGNEQSRIGMEDTGSPTVSTEVLFIVTSIAAKLGMKFGVADVEGAYLEADMIGDPVLMQLNPTVSRCLIDIDNSYAKSMDASGKVVVKLDKALYGCVQSAKLWYNKFASIFFELGYKVNGKDQCVFTKSVNGKTAIVCIHVDDLLVFHEEEEVIVDLIDEVKTKVTAVKSETGDQMTYLGMQFTREDNGDYGVSMEKYTSDVVDAWKPRKKYDSPSDANLFKDNDLLVELDDEEKCNFHSGVAKLLYLSKRTRPDILTTVSHLASRVTKPNVQDLAKLNRLFGYLASTIDYGILFSSDGNNELIVYCDAAYLCHEDTKSRTGVVAILNGGVVAAKSSKQKMVTKSSTEAELVAICDGVSWALYCKEFVEELGFDFNGITVHEDNKSVLDLIHRGNATNKGSKHIKMRYFFVKQHVDAKEIEVKWCPTEVMLADVLTKPMVGDMYKNLRDCIVHNFG